MSVPYMLIIEIISCFRCFLYRVQTGSSHLESLCSCRQMEERVHIPVKVSFLAYSCFWLLAGNDLWFSMRLRFHTA